MPTAMTETITIDGVTLEEDVVYTLQVGDGLWWLMLSTRRISEDGSSCPPDNAPVVWILYEVDAVSPAFAVMDDGAIRPFERFEHVVDHDQGPAYLDDDGTVSLYVDGHVSVNMKKTVGTVHDLRRLDGDTT